MGKPALKHNEWPEIRLRWQQPNTLNHCGFIGYGNLSRDLTSVITADADARCSLHLLDPSKHLPESGASTRLLLTMWESKDFPREYIDNVDRADVLIVPSKFCADIFRQFLPDKPIHILPLAVDIDSYSYVRRKPPRVDCGQKFRWLWVNAPDVRKGYHLLAQVWEKGFMDDPSCELYLKTTNNTEDRLERRGNVIFDSRFIAKDDLVGLYHSAHGYVYPSWGEGFGYTLAEAMATGLPSVATNYSGHTDFFNGANGYPVKWTPWRVTRNLAEQPDTKCVSMADDGNFEVAICNARHLVTQMFSVMERYGRGLDRGKRAAKKIRRDYTLPAMARSLASIVKEYS